MFLIDTHAHLYLDEFKDDRAAVVDRAIANGITKILLPNIDEESVVPMLGMVQDFPTICFPMMGMHPTSVKQNYASQLDKIFHVLYDKNCIAIGEVGVDLYWDKTFLKEQQQALEFQIQWAIKMDLPVVFHMRDSFNELWDIVKNYSNITGVFHCYSGTIEQAEVIVDKGFYLGIGGVVTYKKSTLPEVITKISIDKILLETDAPFLTPMPYRGKRNESAYIKNIAEKIAEIKGISLEDVAKTTTNNALRLFKL